MSRLIVRSRPAPIHALVLGSGPPWPGGHTCSPQCSCEPWESVDLETPTRRVLLHRGLGDWPEADSERHPVDVLDRPRARAHSSPTTGRAREAGSRASTAGPTRPVVGLSRSHQED
jgi:hypothetical protein